MTNPDEQADRYEDFSIPFVWPLNALKIHAVQFGISLGVLLGMLGRTGSALAVDLWVAGGTLEARTVAILVALSIAMYAIGIREAGPVEKAEGDDSAIGAIQIRRKPHYLVVPMVFSFVVVLLF